METVKKQLVEGEQITHVSYIHWAIFLHPLGILTVAALVAVFFHWLPALAIVVMDFYPAVNALIRYLTTRLVLTNKRVFARAGFFNKDHIQLKLERIESAALEEPFVGQMLGYSTVVINGTGTGHIPLTFIADGGVFVKKLETAILTQT